MNPKGRIRTTLAFLLVVVAVSMTSAWLIGWGTAAPPVDSDPDAASLPAKPLHPVTILRPGVPRVLTGRLAKDGSRETIGCATCHATIKPNPALWVEKDGKFLFHMTNDKGEEIPSWDWDQYYSDEHNVDRALYEEYRGLTHLKHKNVAPYDELVKTQGLRWPVVQQEDGSWRETKFRFSEFDDPFVEKGKEIQFYHSTSKDDRAQIWFCPYEPPAEEPDKEFPFWLCTGRVLEHWHTGTMTMRVRQLRAAMPHTYVELHPDDAAELGLGNGDIALLQTRRGEIRLPVWNNGRGNPPRGSVFVPFFDETLLINELTIDAHCPISKEPDYKKCAVSVTKAPPTLP